jgi:hypothetical protein
VYYGKGDGTFLDAKEVAAAGNLPQGAVATDHNGDLLPDLVVLSNSEPSGNGLSVMLQTY